MTKIIGHRGAAGLALENTLASIRLAREYAVDAIEIDIRRTQDNHIVLSHDEHLARVSIADTVLAEIDLADLLNIKLSDDGTVPTLAEAIEACGDTPVIIEIKEEGTAELLLTLVERYSEKHISVTSFVMDELRIIRTVRPDIPVFLAEHLKPIEVIAHARNIGAAGITLNAWLLNPLTYLLARRYKLDIMVYTVNSAFIGRFLRRLYPRIMICTDRPDRFKRRRLWKRTRNAGRKNRQKHTTIQPE